MPNGATAPAIASRWFKTDATFDAELLARFGHALAAFPASIDETWLQTPQSHLAAILLCDQLPRNLFRGTSQAFAWDERGRQLAYLAIDRRINRDLTLDQQAFCYLPLMHSEKLRDQHLAVGCFTDLRDSAPAPLRQSAGNYLRHAQQHRDTILRFGRFPYRNAALDRSSTAAERTFLSQG